MPDFPTTPVDGDTHVIATSTWKYYSSTDRWEIEDTSGVPQSVSTLLETLTWTAGDATVTSSPIVYSDYSTITITYAGIHAFSSGAITAFQVKNSPTGTANEIRSYGVGDHLSQMSGTSNILTATGTSNSNTFINSIQTYVENLNFIGPDNSTLIFGWAGTGVFAAGGSIEIRGTSLQIQPNTLTHLDDVNAISPTDGQVLAWDNTNSYWKSTNPSGVVGTGAGIEVGGSVDLKIIPTVGNLSQTGLTNAISMPDKSTAIAMISGTFGDITSCSIINANSPYDTYATASGAALAYTNNTGAALLVKLQTTLDFDNVDQSGEIGLIILETAISYTPPTSAGDVGTYIFAGPDAVGSITLGSTIAGSTLLSSGFASTNALNDDTAADIRGSALSGTWRAMGNVNLASRRASTLFLRIS